MASGRTPGIVWYCALAGAAYMAYTYGSVGSEQWLVDAGIGGVAGALMGGVLNGMINLMHRPPAPSPPRQFKVLRPRAVPISWWRRIDPVVWRSLGAVAFFLLLVGDVYKRQISELEGAIVALTEARHNKGTYRTIARDLAERAKRNLQKGDVAMAKHEIDEAITAVNRGGEIGEPRH